MREILFRGKRIDNGDWVHGIYYTMYSLDEEKLVYAIDMCGPHGYTVIVEPESIGQYIGVNDKEGNKIFEGDILMDTGFKKDNTDENLHYEIKWDEENLKFEAYCTTSCMKMGFMDVDAQACVVVGNIYENPELIKV